MLLHDARRAARVDRCGRLVLLEDQDRTLWDRRAIEEGTDVLNRALRMRRPGPYQVQAAIAALHSEPLRADDTDWREIALLYGQLARMAPSPVVELNRAVAIAMAEGAVAGLRIVDQLVESGVLADYHLLHATRADLLRRLGRDREAEAAYVRAIRLTANRAEREFLEGRLNEVRERLVAGEAPR
jgi:RNA polymerase sigma-70 factor (ECF subfamily)